MAWAVVGYAALIFSLGDLSPEVFDVATFIHDYWVTQLVIVALLAPSVTVVFGSFGSLGRAWVRFRLVYTLMMVVGMTFLGIITFLTLGPSTLGWVTFLAMALIAAVCHINVRVAEEIGSG
jgi:hypothetical protein